MSVDGRDHLGLVPGGVRRQGEDREVGDGPPACLGGHGRAVLVHRSAPGDDGRAGRRSGRERLALGAVGLPSRRLRGRARAVGLGSGTDRSWGWSVTAAPGSLSCLPADAGVAAGQCAAAPGGRGDGDWGGAAGQGHRRRAPPDRGAAAGAGLDGAGMASPDRRGRAAGAGCLCRIRRAARHRVHAAGCDGGSGRGGGGAARGAGLGAGLGGGPPAGRVVLVVAAGCGRVGRPAARTDRT